jgi:glycerol-3-phosphate cytidylyltransferase-like family protein
MSNNDYFSENKIIKNKNNKMTNYDRLLSNAKFYEEIIKINYNSQLNLYARYNSSFVFGYIIYFCEDFIKIKLNDQEKNIKIIRFLNITKKLPIELQMLICNRLYNFNENIILTKYSNKIFELLKYPFFWKGEKIDYVKLQFDN